MYMHNTEHFISSSTVKEQGRSKYYKMLDKARQGDLIQICRGIYATSEQLSGNMIDIDAVVKGGILCLWSAWNIHKLTTSMPQAFHIAIRRGRKVTVPAFPQIEIHHYTEKILNVGVMKMTIDGFSVNVYDAEKCVCDAVKFRNKIGTALNVPKGTSRNLWTMQNSSEYTRLLRNTWRSNYEQGNRQ